MASSDLLATEIINHSTDRCTAFALRIPTEIHPGYFEHVTITSPVKNGRRVIIIQFPKSQGAVSLIYPVDDNLEGAVFCLTSFMLYGDGECTMEMKPINTRTGGVDEQFTLASWNLNITPTRGSGGGAKLGLGLGQDEVHEQVKKIVMTLFCDSGDIIKDGNPMGDEP
ncbi:hypothetical protein ACHAXR_008641 [Thalassiosira sp. AJA248-18]